MEDESSLPHYSTVQFPIPGMESVVATVSGYHGSERFQLIKLISRSGASYVGTMNRSTTHLVCWKHEGRKYELAKEFGNFIVNHRWVEECVKQGRRVPEKPYLLESGQEVGPLVLEVPVLNERVRKLPPYQHPYKVLERPELDMDPELDSRVAGAHSWFLNEGMISNCGPSNNKSHNINKKDGRHSNHVCSTSRHYKKHALHEAENEEPFSPSKLLPSEQRRSLAKPESHHKVRRLVKKNVIDLDSEEGSRPIGVADQLDGLITRSSGSNKRRDKKRLRHRVISDDEFVDCEDVNESSQEMPHIHIPKDSNVQSGVAPIPMESTSLDLCPNANEITKAKISRLAESTDLSCVICWTNFSSTRGVLPCGHRFCFSCIQSWADVMVMRGKASTCPLCKASFSSITKVDDASCSDQKIFSQTIPCNSSIKDIFILPGDEMRTFGPQPEPNPACSECSFREPEDLLVKCHLCQVRCVHSYCLDPPLLPWACIHCKDLQMVYRHLY